MARCPRSEVLGSTHAQPAWPHAFATHAAPQASGFEEPEYANRVAGRYQASARQTGGLASSATREILATHMKRLAQRGTDINLQSGPQMHEYEAITARIARDAPSSVLDWGCGWGQVSHLLKRAGLNVASFDFRPEADDDGLRPLERFPDVEAYISATEPRELPYDDEQFDAVLSCGVLEHVIDPDASLEEIKRVLRPGGTLYVYKLPNRFSYLEWIARRLAGRGLYYHGRDPYDVRYDVRSAHDLMSRHGIAVTELRRANMLPLTLDGPRCQQHSATIWKVNQTLSRVPLLNRLATNVEVIAKVPSSRVTDRT